MNTKLKTAMPGRLWICAAGMLAIVALVVGLFASQGMARADESTPTLDLAVEKNWIDTSGQKLNEWPSDAKVTVELLCNGEQVSNPKKPESTSWTLDLTTKKQTGVFDGLTLKDDSIYTVREVSVSGVPENTVTNESSPTTYTDKEPGSDPNTFKSTAIITNTYTPALGTMANQNNITIEGEKVWKDELDPDDHDPIEVILLAGGDETGVTARASKDTNWKFSFGGLSDGETYTVKDNVEGYATALGDKANNFTITNTRTGKTTVTVSKSWKLLDGSIKWPDNAEVTIAVKNGVTEVETYTLTSSEQSHSFTNLDEFDENGKKITYSVEEKSKAKVTGSFNVIVEEPSDNEFAITNVQVYEPAKAPLSIKKTVTGDTSDKSYNKDEEFSFTLAKVDKDGKARTDGSDVLPSSTTAKTKAGETATFEDITYTEAGTYYYTITEAKGKTSGMTYDEKARYAKVEVTEDKDNKKLVASVTYSTTTSEDSYKADPLTVTNTFKAASTPTTSAKTGDALPIVAVLVVVLISGACVVVALVRRKKQQD